MKTKWLSIACVNFSVLICCAGLGKSYAQSEADVATGGLAVNPVRLEMGHDQPSTALKVNNTMNSPQLMQATVMEWSQNTEGEDFYTLQDRKKLESGGLLIATPPLFSLEPLKGMQIVRLGLTQNQSGNKELVYRVFIEQVPDKNQEGKEGSVRIRLRMGVPLFIKPAYPKKAVEFAVHASKNGEWSVIVKNEGNIHTRIDQIVLIEKSKPVCQVNNFFYVLAGKTKTVECAANNLKNASAIFSGTQNGIEITSDDAPAKINMFSNY